MKTDVTDGNGGYLHTSDFDQVFTDTPWAIEKNIASKYNIVA
jgi:hypothetical protein